MELLRYWTPLIVRTTVSASGEQFAAVPVNVIESPGHAALRSRLTLSVRQGTPLQRTETGTVRAWPGSALHIAPPGAAFVKPVP